MYIQDKQGGSLEKLGEATDSFIAELSKSPAVAAAYSSFDPRFPQYIVEVKNAVCKRRGVSPQEVLNTLSTYVAGSFVSDINLYANTYKVVLQTKPEHRISEDSLSSFYVRNNKGKMLPIRQFLTFTQTYGPELITNFNLFTSISLNVSIADGYSTSDVLKAIEEASKKALPKGYGYDFGGLTREQAEMNPYAQYSLYLHYSVFAVREYLYSSCSFNVCAISSCRRIPACNLFWCFKQYLHADRPCYADWSGIKDCNLIN